MLSYVICLEYYWARFIVAISNTSTIILSVADLKYEVREWLPTLKNLLSPMLLCPCPNVILFVLIEIEMALAQCTASYMVCLDSATLIIVIYSNKKRRKQGKFNNLSFC